MTKETNNIVPKSKAIVEEPRKNSTETLKSHSTVTNNEGQVSKKAHTSEEDEIDTIPTDSHQHSAEAIDPQQLNRWIMIYSAVIKNQLAPSTPLEMHLLLRLLAVPDDANISSSSSSIRKEEPKAENRKKRTKMVPYFPNARSYRFFFYKSHGTDSNNYI